MKAAFEAAAAAAAGLLWCSWLAVWLLKPTQLWKKAWHAVEDGAGRSFAGDYGVNVIVFVLPLLGAAAAGYLHLRLLQMSHTQVRKGRLTAVWSRPIAVAGPLGVLFPGELLAVALFVAVLAWTYCINVAGDFQKLAPYAHLKLDRWKLRLMHMGVRIGSLSELCLAILLLPVLRGMSVFRIVGVQLESSVRYHTWIANTMILLSTLHGLCIMFVWCTKNRLLQELLSWERVGRVNVAGAIALVLGLAIWGTSLPSVRRTRFHTFYLVHHLYLLFILFFLFHAGHKHFCLVLPGVLLFALDKIQRLVQARREVRLVAAHQLPCDAVELVLPKNPSMEYKPTSVIFLKVPSISRLQWHPFSISSCCRKDDSTLSLLVKQQGPWTKSLCRKISEMQEAEADQKGGISVAVDGPYGPAECLHQRYRALILVAGGSGITPVLSMLQDISARSINQMQHPLTICLIFCIKRTKDLSLMAPISSLLLGYDRLENLKLEIFVTQESGSIMSAQEISVSTLLQKPPTAATSSPGEFIETQEGLLWNAVITISAFLLFLTSMICFNHLFVRGEKHSAPDATPSWVPDLIMITSFIIAISCCTMATALHSWKRSRNNTGQVPSKPNRDAPNQQLVEQDAAFAYNIHFGKRPNLEEVLPSFCKETDETEIGVFVCGPDSMKVAAASFCRDFSKKNKHGNGSRNQSLFFHSLNFSL